MTNTVVELCLTEFNAIPNLFNKLYSQRTLDLQSTITSFKLLMDI